MSISLCMHTKCTMHERVVTHKKRVKLKVMPLVPLDITSTDDGLETCVTADSC